MRKDLADFGAKTGFRWIISPANSPWRQGRAEVRVKLLKRLINISVGSNRLTPLELQTVLFEVANLSNERPIGVNKTPNADGSFEVLTPNSLLIGRSSNEVPDDIQLAAHLKKSERYQIIQAVTEDFWKRWAEQVTPEAIIRQKWHEQGRNLMEGDIVLIHDKGPIKGKYTLGIVDSVDKSQDQLVRSVKVGYMVPNGKDRSSEYTGGKRIVVSRSIQKLTLLLPVEDQDTMLQIRDGKIVKQQ